MVVLLGLWTGLNGLAEPGVWPASHVSKVYGPMWMCANHKGHEKLKDLDFCSIDFAHMQSL